MMCPHGDPMCPCNDGDACNYVTVTLPDGRVSVASPCPRTGQVDCTRCTRDEFRVHGEPVG